MQISSYTFQSPYPQPFQVGRPDPSSAKQEETSKNIDNSSKEPQKTEAKVAPTKASTKESVVKVSIGTLIEGSAQSSVAEFKSLSVSIQGQKAYAQESVL